MSSSGFEYERNENEGYFENKENKWYEKREADEGVIISSRIRLARNLKNHPFPARLNQDGAKKVIKEISDSVINERTAVGKLFLYEELTDKPYDYLLEMLERHVISPEMTSKKGVRGLLLSGDESVCVMLNEEDHARIQTIYAGDDLDRAFNIADKVDDLIEESVEYAFDPEFGYLTSCPTNTGTGLRASFMLHLPALEQTGNIGGIAQAVSKFGIAVRGIHGEGSEPAGSVYQISNQTTLGKPEAEMLDAIKSVTKQIIEQENMIKSNILTDIRKQAEDKVYRAYGILTNSRILKLPEALSLLSDIRTGYSWGILDAPRPKKTIYNLMMDVQRGSIIKRIGETIDDSECDIVRAVYLREMF